jgi:D-3-phosphoglycerate dehydrogenase
MSKYKVVVVNLGYESYQVEREILEPVDAELILAPKDCLTENDVISVAKDADAILVREAPISARVLDSINRCKVIVRYGVGVDNINLEAAKQKKIYVANTPGYGTEEVSDHAVALLLACIRKLCGRGSSKRILTTRFTERLGKPWASLDMDKSAGLSTENGRDFSPNGCWFSTLMWLRK